jgi:hypothetical protein
VRNGWLLRSFMPNASFDVVFCPIQPLLLAIRLRAGALRCSLLSFVDGQLYVFVRLAGSMDRNVMRTVGFGWLFIYEKSINSIGYRYWHHLCIVRLRL